MQFLHLGLPVDDDDLNDAIVDCIRARFLSASLCNALLMPTSRHSLPPPSKKRKTLNSATENADTIKQFEDEITNAVAKNSSLNRLANLVALLFDLEEPHDTSKAIYALYRVFVLIISSGKLGFGGDEAAKVVRASLWENLNSFVDYLGGLLQDQEKFLRISALQIMFSLLKHLSASLTQSSGKSQFQVSHFQQIVSSLLLCPRSRRKSNEEQLDRGLIVDSDVVNLFYETWFSVHDDIRWFFLREAGTLMNKHNVSEYPSLGLNLLTVLERLTTFPTEQSELNAWWVVELGAKPPKPKKTKGGSEDMESSSSEDMFEKENEDEDDWRKFFEEEQKVAVGSKSKVQTVRLRKMTVHQSLHSLSSHKAVFTRTWLTLLHRLSVVGDIEKTKAMATRVLNIMHRGVMPHLTRPILIMDWVTACVDLGGTVGLLALNALFILIKEYNLDYPSFYTRLYAFLDQDLLHLKHRARFFRLTDIFLSSTHLPAALLASFVKKLSRLSLTAPPAAIVMVIPFTYNIFKRHPALMVMIHRTGIDDPWTDPFLADESDPMKTRAHESSLWELVSHTSHYHAPVSTLCKIFSEAFTKPGYAMEDFLDHTYHTLIETELNRKIKREPALGIESGVKVFPDEGESDQSDVVGELWTFS